MSARLNVKQLQDSLCTELFGKSILFSREADSTNEWAKEQAKQGAPEGTVVITETQKKGRGRLGREWISPRGGLWFSIILKPKFPPAEAVKLTFVAGLAVARVLRKMFDLKAEIKWPNDIMVKGRKICGILTETNTTGETINYVIVGVGVNANFSVDKACPNSLKRVATSLEDELGRKVQLEKLLRALLEQLENLYRLLAERGFDLILEQWKSYTSFLGCHIEVTSSTEEISGLALNIDREGALILQLEDGNIRRLIGGDVYARARA